MTLGEIIFVFMTLVTIFGALATVLMSSMIYALIGLIVTMFGIAGLYVYLNAPFVAMMQILIYVGAICILIVFAVMIAGPHYLRRRPIKEWKISKLLIAFAISVFTFLIFLTFIRGNFDGDGKMALINTKDLGRALFDTYAFPFELISLLIMVSIVGAIMLVLSSKEEK
ncbi:MAG: NADH-quinone oxidoreductase subunit J [Syntrophobacterales bacterium]|jgi:NADH-quinone oxidoreductase subunit J|nr:NADH-quinone oxidoreductase subunit J [Syntrophobacterales bacterium]